MGDSLVSLLRVGGQGSGVMVERAPRAQTPAFSNLHPPRAMVVSCFSIVSSF
jgi:hypothetical protein